MKAGVVDPTKVTRYALQNAASISALMLTTEALVTEMSEKEKPASGIECIKTYTKEHSLDPANLIPLAMKAITRFGWISLD